MTERLRILLPVPSRLGHLRPPPKEGFIDTIPLPTMLAPKVACIDESSEQTWTLVRHMLLLPFWGPAVLLHNIRHDKDTLIGHMRSYHCLDAWWLQTMGDCIGQEDTCDTTFLLTFRQGVQQ